MVLGSATGFATLAIFAKLAYSSGLGTEQTLAFRFLLAALGILTPPGRYNRQAMGRLAFQVLTARLTAA